MDGAKFGLDPYHILLAGCGLAIIVAYWLPRFLHGREPAASGLLILGGLAVFGLLPGVPDALSPIDNPRVWELASEFAVIIALFGTGIRIDRFFGKGLWSPTVRLLVIAMPLCILAVAALGMGIGLTLAAACCSRRCWRRPIRCSPPTCRSAHRPRAASIRCALR